MTRINTTPAAIRKPDSVLFGELAIAAGMTGNPVAVCFSESAAVVDCELWKYLAQCAGPGRAMHVHSQIDVRKLTKAVGSCPLVVVHAPRLFNTVAWTVQSMRTMKKHPSKRRNRHEHFLSNAKIRSR